MELAGTESCDILKCYSMDMSTDLIPMSVFSESPQGKHASYLDLYVLKMISGNEYEYNTSMIVIYEFCFANMQLGSIAKFFCLSVLFKLSIMLVAGSGL